MKGQEISIVKLSRLHLSSDTFRFDPEYFQKQYLKDEERVILSPEKFRSFTDLGLRINASAFYPAIEEYYGTGTFPFLRVADVDSVIDFDNCIRIPDELCSRFSTLSQVYPGDIVFTKGGSIARVGLVTEKAAVSRDLIFINSSTLNSADQVFLYLFFQTSFFNRLLLRSSSQTAQPHLTITLVRNLPVFIGSNSVKEKCLELVKKSYEFRDLAIRLYNKTVQRLFEALGLTNWKPSDPLSYIQKASEVFCSGRLDAEHYKPKYDELENFIRNTGQFAPLDSLLSIIQRGSQPEYAETGVPVINSKHVVNGEVQLTADNRKGSVSRNALTIQYGDVLINGTGVGTIGRAAPYLHLQEALPDNHVTILRPKEDLIDSVYLSVFLNSVCGQYQVEKWFRGSSGQIELYPNDIGRFLVWLAPPEVQQILRKETERAFEAKRYSERLLDSSKLAVEIAIEKGDCEALAFLNEVDIYHG